MAESQNGWRVLDEDTSGPPPRLRSWLLPGINRKLLARDGSAGFLLVHLAMWFDEEIERIDVGTYDDWGYAKRQVSGSSDYSNHASGTALDLNATQHPMGVATSQTFTRDEIFSIHNRLKLYSGCLRWGGDYRSRPDAMHWELVKAMPAVQRKARALLNTPRGEKILDANPGARKLIRA
jgi:hypothetical protein